MVLGCEERIGRKLTRESSGDVKENEEN